MNTFSLFVSRLVQLVGAELCKSLTHEFAGQTIQFPITPDYIETKNLLSRKVTRNLTVFIKGVEYDVSHIQAISVGDIINISIDELTPLDLDRFVIGSGLPRVIGPDDETNQTAPDLQVQSHGHVQPHLSHRDETARSHLDAAAPEAAESQALDGAQVNQPALDTQSEVHRSGLANVDQP